MPFSLIASWALIEADMQREYGIDLVRQLPQLSWRRFMVLVRGLSPNAATVVSHRSRQHIGQRRADVILADTPAAAERHFARIFGAPKAH